MRRLKYFTRICVVVGAITISLSGCGKKESLDDILMKCWDNVRTSGSVSYTSNIDLKVTSEIYGETMDMYQSSNISTDRNIKTSEIHSFTDYSEKIFKEPIKGKVENFVTLGGVEFTGFRNYRTTDGKVYNYTKKERERSCDRYGILGLIEYFDKENTILQPVEKDSKGYILDTEITGGYLRYLIDETDMVDLYNFKEYLDTPIHIQMRTYLDENKLPTDMVIDIIDTSDLFDKILGGVYKDDVVAHLDTFRITVNYSAYIGIEIILPAECKDAQQASDTDNDNVKAIKNESLTPTESTRDKVGSFSYEVPAGWELSEDIELEGSQSSSETSAHSKTYKHMYSNSKVTITGGVSVKEITDKYGDINKYSKIEQIVTDKQTELSELYPNTEMKYIQLIQNEESGAILKIPYIVCTNTLDNGTEYLIYVYDDLDEYQVKVYFDNSNVYKEYYNEVVDNFMNTLKI